MLACTSYGWGQTAPALLPKGPVLISAAADAPPPAKVPPVPTTPQTPQAPATPPTVPMDQANAFPPQEAGAEAPGGGFAPQMIGDSIGISAAIEPPRGFMLQSSSSQGFGSRVFTNGVLQGPLAVSVSGYKITDNESPLPQDRAYLTFNYFTGVDHSTKSPGAAETRIDRETFGYEKAFFDGDLSFGVRVPFIQEHFGPSTVFTGTDVSDVGDVTLIAKYAFLRDRDNGSTVTGGLALTLPTGPATGLSIAATNPVTGAITTINYNLNTSVIQPFVGYLLNFGDAYVEGFSSLGFFTNDNISTEWYNDVAVGYHVYRGEGQVRSVVPTVELHLTTPFGHQGSDGFPVAQIDTFITTLGLHTVFRNNSVLTAAVEFPLSGPEPFSTELVLQFNYHF
jgi:hypothetical protein